MLLKKPAVKSESEVHIKILIIFITFLIFFGCSSKEVYYEIPYDLRTPALKKEFISKYSPYIKDKKFFLDPGHGGDDRRNKGHQDLVVEADANLKVALYLKKFLQEAGASVVMSRETDITVELKERSIRANKSGADLFVSIHHNAPGKVEDNWTNYTSTYYHATETGYEYEPSERELAKYIQRDLAYAMRNSGGPGSFDGTYSDYTIYPGQGFSVLRVTEIPAVLVECGFHTNEHEERRLALEEFNMIEAWGIFRGLCRYFSAGVPEIIFLNENEKFYSDKTTLSFLLKDSSGINPLSIKIFFDSVYVSNFSFDEKTNILNVNLADREPGEHVVRILVQNRNGNHSFPYHKKVIFF